MNTDQNNNIGATNVAGPETEVKRGPGRPRKPECLRKIFVNPETLAIRGRGKPKFGTKYKVLYIQRSAKYVAGVTPIVKSEDFVVAPENQTETTNS